MNLSLEMKGEWQILETQNLLMKLSKINDSVYQNIKLYNWELSYFKN